MASRVTAPGRLLPALAVLSLLLSACGVVGGSDHGSTQEHQGSGTQEATGHGEATDEGSGHGAVEPVAASPLRRGERRLTVEMADTYTPSAPTGTGTDDYRCFLIDPELEEDAYLTGTHVLPGNPDVVHHVILFRVDPEEVPAARQLDDAVDGPGWTCFGGTGLKGPGEQLRDAGWLAAWAPGGEESVTKRGHGVRLRKGTQVVMQVHYNLMAGIAPDLSATQLRLAPVRPGMTELSTMLLPAPVELPCREEYADGPLCDRDAAMLDLMSRFGAEESKTANILHWLCGEDWEPGEVTTCVRPVEEPMTVHGVAAHMHLLGREIRIELNPGTPRARTLLDIPVWDFDEQGGIPIKPVSVKPGDEVSVTCRHVQWLRDDLPAFEGQPDRYVVWGDGTTDEMCLGMLQVSRP